jgi:DNA-directed RNA polymerase specialized sigma24 family protein
MYELPPELSPDLEWMLLGKQATAEMLARGVVQEYGAQVLRLALALLNDQAAGQRATEATFVEAIMNAHRFSAERGVRDWIIALAIQACGKQVPRSMVVLALYYLLGWQAGEIAALLRIKREVVQEYLAEFRTRYQHDLDMVGQADLGAEQLDRRLTELFQLRWPDPQVTDDEMHQQVGRILKKAQSREFRRRASTSITEVSLIGFLILAVVGLMWGVNKLSPDIQPTPRIVFRTVLVTRMVTPVVIAVDQVQDPAHPVSSEKSGFIPVNLVSLLLNDRSKESGQLPRSEPHGWKTMWLDAEFTDRPPGCIGPARRRRIQAWISPTRVLVLNGHPGVGPTAVDLVILQEDSYIRAVPGGPQTKIYQADSALLFSFPSYSENLAALLAPMSEVFPAIRPKTFDISSGEDIAGRPTIILKSSSQQGIQSSATWIDRETHLLLRQLRYEDTCARQLRSMVQVNAVAYDVGFPAELFDQTKVWQRGFVRDYKGTPDGTVIPAVYQTSPGTQVLPPYPEPSGELDSAASRLIFQISDSNNTESPRGAGKGLRR